MISTQLTFLVPLKEDFRLFCFAPYSAEKNVPKQEIEAVNESGYPGGQPTSLLESIHIAPKYTSIYILPLLEKWAFAESANITLQSLQNGTHLCPDGNASALRTATGTS
ncbi:hypothetical protein CDAR_169711 [Caerostris darwini]|uniref:Uncharacterized protein n=1 Tax=Caerostris darwini TaxID=1538125 RepID=A0AAV4PH67_9ARAC|nr:hypothetical protein CDAR_169711 [Caerostris darwini]